MRDGETALYRHFDEAGNLLYVGISLNAVARLSQHAQGSTWAGDIRRVTVEMFSARKPALVAEANAIKSERPRFNKKHSVRPKHTSSSDAGIKPPDPPGDEWMMSISANRYVGYRSLPPPDAQIIYFRNGKLRKGQFIYLRSRLDAFSNIRRA